MLEHGLHSRNSPNRDPNFRNIGNPDLIERRHHRNVPIPPDGTLSDYIPFYFTPFSIMMYNIHTGYGGLERVPNREILILVSSLHRVAKLGVNFAFTDKHSYLQTAAFSNLMDDLKNIDWALLNTKDFRNNPEDPGKKERYQAEALVHQYLPVEGLLGIGCVNDDVKEELQEAAGSCNFSVEVLARPHWYF